MAAGAPSAIVSLPHPGNQHINNFSYAPILGGMIRTAQAEVQATSFSISLWSNLNSRPSTMLPAEADYNGTLHEAGTISKPQLAQAPAKAALPGAQSD